MNVTRQCSLSSQWPIWRRWSGKTWYPCCPYTSLSRSSHIGKTMKRWEKWKSTARGKDEQVKLDMHSASQLNVSQQSGNSHMSQCIVPKPTGFARRIPEDEGNGFKHSGTKWLLREEPIVSELMTTWWKTQGRARPSLNLWQIYRYKYRSNCERTGRNCLKAFAGVIRGLVDTIRGPSPHIAQLGSHICPSNWQPILLRSTQYCCLRTHSAVYSPTKTITPECGDC